MLIEWIFQASGDACGTCLALDGTATTTQPHENCQCQIVPDDESGCDWDYTGGSSRYGPGPFDAVFGAELTVTCADGSEIGYSVPVDLGGFTGRGAEVFDWIQEQLHAAAGELCAQCPKPEPPLVA